MKNYGWDEVINRVNARIENGVIVNLKQDETQTPAKTEIATGGAEPQRREAIIFNVCRSFGMSELATSFIGDSRPLQEILSGIYASKMQIQASKIARGQGFGNWVR